ncbi:MAG TPA: lysylphosphatidylglycerol synthase transmembrane domain-containing protein [Ktedonobacterales bacterium]|nr:lysylphosphatidylglycerol synthase transmembrane domain-containing protein [Ktedonobacterales bacterium]
MKGARRPLAIKISIGLLIGMGLLLLVSRFVNVLAGLAVLERHLVTPRGMVLALLAGAAFLLAFSLRGARWKLFLNAVAPVSTWTAVRVYLIGIFVNFLLSFSSGELAKTLILKRVAGIPVNRSLPTVAMDRSLDLLPALVIMALVPFLGLHLDTKLWVVLGIVGGLFLCLAFLVALAAWKRAAAALLIKKMTLMLPRAFGSKVETFATGFVDSLLMGVSRPQVFIPAVGLTCLALCCDSLFAMLIFWMVGFPLPFGEALFGYTLYNMFFILPTPPGQLGSNEAVGLLVFGGLLHLPPGDVIAMFLFSHPWAALLMCASGMTCLKTLGINASAVWKKPAEAARPEREEQLLPHPETDTLVITADTLETGLLSAPPLH